MTLYTLMSKYKLSIDKHDKTMYEDILKDIARYVLEKGSKKIIKEIDTYRRKDQVIIYAMLRQVQKKLI